MISMKILKLFTKYFLSNNNNNKKTIKLYLLYKSPTKQKTELVQGLKMTILHLITNKY